MSLATDLYQSQIQTWPPEGRHILAHYDDSSIVVYQAYRQSIGSFAVEHFARSGSSPAIRIEPVSQLFHLAHVRFTDSLVP